MPTDQRAQAQLWAIHAVLDVHDGEEALTRIRAIIYGEERPNAVMPKC